MRCILWRHPIRLALCAVLPLILMPELKGFLAHFFGLSGLGALLAVAAGLFAGLLLLPLAGAFLDSLAVRYVFMADHMYFTQSFILRERIRVPYRGISGLSHVSDAAQRSAGLGDIVLETIRHGDTRRGLPAGVSLVDVRHPRQAVKRIDALIRACRQAAEGVS